MNFAKITSLIGLYFGSLICPNVVAQFLEKVKPSTFLSRLLRPDENELITA